MENEKETLRQKSMNDYEANENTTLFSINSGSLQRIADALEGIHEAIEELSILLLKPNDNETNDLNNP